MGSSYDATDKFQSTPSVWRETSIRKIYRIYDKISIHSLRVEGDLAADTCCQIG